MSEPKLTVRLTDAQVRAVLMAIYFAQENKPYFTSPERQALNHAADVLGAARVQGDET